MNYPEKVRKIQNNAKALSPVVASIILIAVTVAVSIAVAVWMGGLSSSFMQTEQVRIEDLSFATGAAGNVTLTVKNAGTTGVTISSIYLNGAKISSSDISVDMPFTIDANGEETVVFDAEIVAGDNYEIKVVTSKGNSFSTTAIPPY